jgi:hypothetical protein
VPIYLLIAAVCFRLRRCGWREALRSRTPKIDVCCRGIGPAQILWEIDRYVFSPARPLLRLERIAPPSYTQLEIALGPAGGGDDIVEEEGSMNTKLYLTVAAVVAILYALVFLLIPVQASLFFSDFAEPRAILYLRFCGAAILAWGLIVWFARNFEGRYAVRSVLIASVVGLAVNIVINVWATLQGWLNAKAWGSTAVLVLLLLGGLYELSQRLFDDRS